MTERTKNKRMLGQTNQSLSDRRLWTTACHEAGHAVVSDVLGVLGNDSTITISRDSSVHGSVEFSEEGDNDVWKQWKPSYIRKAVVAFFAGPAVTIKLDPGVNLAEEGGLYELDILRARSMAEWLCDPFFSDHEGDPNQWLFLDSDLWKEAVALVEQHWSSITSAASELIRHRTLKGKRVKALIQICSKGP